MKMPISPIIVKMSLFSLIAIIVKIIKNKKIPYIPKILVENKKVKIPKIPINANKPAILIINMFFLFSIDFSYNTKVNNPIEKIIEKNIP
jgi:hypothetical protein